MSVTHRSGQTLGKIIATNIKIKRLLNLLLNLINKFLILQAQEPLTQPATNDFV